MTALYRSGRQAEALDAYKDARRALVDELGIEPSAALQELERAILRQEPALDLPATAPASAGEIAERSILVAITHETRVDALLAVAEPLVRDPPRVMVLARLVSDAAELRSASAWLEERRSALEARGVVARAASFTSTAPGEELARLATELDVELLLADAPDELLAEGAPDERLTAVLAETPCDVALLVARDATPEGPVLVPFGGAEHDWAAVELGAWFARAERCAAPARRCRRGAGARQARREPPALARRARRPTGPGHLGRAAVGSAGRRGHAGGEPRRRSARRRAVDEVAPRGPWPGPPQTRQRGHPADAARPARSAPRRPRSAARAHALHLVDSPLSRTQVAQAGSYGRPGRNSSHSSGVSVRFASAQARCAHDSGSTSQMAPRPSAGGHQQLASVGGQVDRPPGGSRP